MTVTIETRQERRPMDMICARRRPMNFRAQNWNGEIHCGHAVFNLSA
jgi:hypothetical protein